MSTIQMRPTFVLETKLDKREAIKCIRASFIKTSDGKLPCGYGGQFVDNHAMIFIDDSRRHFWSPWLHLEIDEFESHRRILGRFSPHPSIWTAFVFSYLGIAVLVFFAAMFGVSQQLSGESPHAYILIPIGLVAAAMLWIASQAGRGLAADQMLEMKSKLEGCVCDDC